MKVERNHHHIYPHHQNHNHRHQNHYDDDDDPSDVVVCDRGAGFYTGQMCVTDSFMWNPF